MTVFTPLAAPLQISQGIVIQSTHQPEADAARQLVNAELHALGLTENVEGTGCSAALGVLQWTLKKDRVAAWMPGLNTFDLCERAGLQSRSSAADLKREIWLTLLASPMAWAFPSAEELISAVRMRLFIVQAARKTTLDFHTSEAERPNDCWTYQEKTGFTVLPGSPLIEALIKATQPEASGMLYAFSCYRATEYILLLAIAQEAQLSNPALLAALQKQWETRAVMSGRFHEVFLRETGSMEAPLPISYYIPGDRVWFRNPDDASSDVAGFEGSWVFYLGGGQFSNFWQRNKPFTLASKCVDVYQWRNSTALDANGELQMDEERVEQLVDTTMTQAAEVERITQRMFRLRDPQGVYAEGGCMDTSRESPRWVLPETTDIVLPGMY
ncbi:MAG: hypothetical protein HQ445_01750 [Polaromonas sp.]|nr:hypothetical protein [Polaromonas sp.]